MKTVVLFPHFHGVGNPRHRLRRSGSISADLAMHFSGVPEWQSLLETRLACIAMEFDDFMLTGNERFKKCVGQRHRAAPGILFVLFLDLFRLAYAQIPFYFPSGLGQDCEKLASMERLRMLLLISFAPFSRFGYHLSRQQRTDRFCYPRKQ